MLHAPNVLFRDIPWRGISGRAGAGLVLITLSLGCSQDGPTNPVDTVVATPACTTDEACGEGEVCNDGTCEDGDRDNSLEEATELLFDGLQAGVINPVGDVDWYRFETLTDGTWVQVETLREGNEDTLTDTIITVRARNGQTLMEADRFGAYSITRADASGIVYLPTADTYYVTVEDVRSYLGRDDASGSNDHTYTLSLTPFDSVVTGTVDAPISLTSETSLFRRGVLFPDGDTPAVLSLSTDFDGRVLEVTGDDGVLSSSVVPGIALTMPLSGDMSEVWADQPDATEGRMVQRPDTPAGPWELELYDSSASSGGARWGSIIVRTYATDASLTFFGDSDYPLEVEPNDLPEDAKTMTTTSDTTSSGLAFDQSLVRGVFVSDGKTPDIDRFTFNVPPDGTDPERITARCYADRFGSTADLAIELIDPTGKTLATADSYQEDSAPRIYNVPAVGEGTYTLAVFAENDADGAGAFYRCQVFVTDWDVAE